ncbi:MAG: thioredoxin family protein [Chloroflexi bacterium]|nr:thioredoxin family protein [Chloroflexota bacterium]
MMEGKTLFNPNQDHAQELQRTILRARQERKNILIEVGADWCVWCHRLEHFILSNPELHLLRSQNYIHMRLFSGEGGSLPDVFDKLPPFDGIPHFFVYDFQGNLLHSQHTEPFEVGESYDYNKVWEFLAAWGVADVIH